MSRSAIIIFRTAMLSKREKLDEKCLQKCCDLAAVDTLMAGGGLISADGCLAREFAHLTIQLVCTHHALPHTDHSDMYRLSVVEAPYLGILTIKR